MSQICDARITTPVMDAHYDGHDGGCRHLHEIDQCLVNGDRRHALSLSAKNGNHRIATADGVLTATPDEAMRLVVWLPGRGDQITLRAYGEYLASLLGGRMTVGGSEARVSRIEKDLGDCDLLIFSDPEQSTIERLLFGPVARRVARRVSTTMLLARNPHWPIQRILLVIRVETSEDSAVQWAGRLAHSSGAHLTILPLLPSQPLIYGAGSRLQVGIESLLTPNTPSGEQLRRFLDALEQWEVDGKLRVRQGDPLWQICWECDEGGYDLVIIGAEQGSRTQRWLFGELVGPLIALATRPLLIASSTQRRPPRPEHG